MWQHSIRPWSTRSLVQQKIDRQLELCRISPFRFISVTDGLNHYSKHAGGWIVQLTRERFVQLSLELFEMKGLKCPPEEAKVFYDVFDSIDLYNNATLSIGELAGGLVSFFGGTLNDRAMAVYNLLDYRSTGKVPKQTFSEFLKPFVWSMVPEEAGILRPVLLPYVTDEIFSEMCFSPSNGYVTCSEFVRWVQRGHPNAAQLNASHTVAVFAHAIVDRCATIIEGTVHVAWQEYQGKEDLRSYGRQTWETSHHGRTQRLMDVGMYRYAVANYTQSPVEQPSIFQDAFGHISTQMQGAMQSVGSSYTQSPVEQPSVFEDAFGHISTHMQGAMESVGSLSRTHFGWTEDSDSESEPEDAQPTPRRVKISDDVEVVRVEKDSPPTDRKDRNLAPLPNLLTTQGTDRALPFSSVPASACGLTRPQGFPQVQKSVYAYDIRRDVLPRTHQCSR
jgi:hypothetical protein